MALKHGWMKLAGLFVLAHGMVHLALLTAPTLDGGPGNFITRNGRSWLFESLGLNGISVDVIGIALVIMAIAGFAIASIGMMSMVKLDWRRLLVASSAISLFALIAFWNDWMIGGVLIDVGLILFGIAPRLVIADAREVLA